jgi:hypothetical protein
MSCEYATIRYKGIVYLVDRSMNVYTFSQTNPILIGTWQREEEQIMWIHPNIPKFLEQSNSEEELVKNIMENRND